MRNNLTINGAHCGKSRLKTVHIMRKPVYMIAIVSDANETKLAAACRVCGGWRRSFIFRY